MPASRSRSSTPSSSAVVPVPVEFRLCLAPGHLRTLPCLAAAVEPFRAYGVVRDLRERAPLGVAQQPRRPPRAQPYDRDERRTPRARGQQPYELLRHRGAPGLPLRRLPERQPKLLAGVAAHGQLQVPARVLAARAAAQGRAAAREAQVGGVVVDGVECVDLSPGLRAHSGHGAEGGEGRAGVEVVEVVLAFRLVRRGRHKGNVTGKRGPERARVTEEPRPSGSGHRRSPPPVQADSGFCSLIDWSSPTAIHTANIEVPP
ncbi:hypothetical protein GA0115252_17005 [Streptomyces sp. DfronAA-171]|nr:hypothetical protein GA0115252_17005 [Streptomyces sp. DfronAA-171]